MFDALEEFAKDHSDFLTKCEYLQNVEIVIIDEVTFDFFKSEFEWRYIKKNGPKSSYFYTEEPDKRT